jgi:mannose-6-phosphate isomerase-like protein (cupin superfamily)
MSGKSTAEQEQVRLIHRDDMPSIRTASVDGQVHALGTVKDFRRHEGLCAFVPANVKTSFAWVHLDPSETLDNHVHPVESMIVVARGEGQVTGDLCAALVEGDVVIVPRGRVHGFRGAGTTGFWALSIQFEQRGLYEDESDPLTQFQAQTQTGANSPMLEALLASNRLARATFAGHPVFMLAREHRFADPVARQRLTAHLQVWSDHFQRILRLRSALSDDVNHAAVAEAHLREELGHNEQLGRTLRDVRPWDPVLESMCAWFVWKTQALGDVERTVLVHLVLEAAASVFYSQMQPWFAGDRAANHFDAHVLDDDRHTMMGVEVLRNAAALDVPRLSHLHERGWHVMNAMFDRIVAIL